MSIEDQPIDEVGDALALTVEVLEDSIADMKSATAEAVADERFDTVEHATNRLRELRGFADDVGTLLDRWQSSDGLGGTTAPRASADPGDTTSSASASTSTTSGKHYYGRVPRGTRTPEPEFRRTILEVLRDAGGSLPTAEAVDEVGERMTDRLNDADREVLASDQRTIRWRNTAQWSRNVLADEGFIDRSVRGTWTITDAGRAWLESRE